MEYSEKENPTSHVQFVLCPTCQGEGLVLDANNNVITCPQCRRNQDQRSVYGFWRGKYISFDKRIDAISIVEGRARNTLRTFMNFFFFAFGLLGLIAGLWHGYRVSQGAQWWEAFFSIKDILTKIFWTSILADMYVYYRLIKETTLKKNIPKVSIAPVPQEDIDDISYDKAASLRDEKKQEDISIYFHREGIAAIEKAWELTHEARHFSITAVHLLRSLLTFNDIVSIFSRLGTDPKILIEKIYRNLEKQPRTSDIHRYPAISAEVQKIFLDAFREAERERREKVYTTELLMALAASKTKAAEILYDLEIEPEHIRNVGAWIHFHRDLQQRWQKERAMAIRKPKGIMNRAMTARPTPVLDSIGRDLTLAARSGALFPLIGRRKQLAALLRVLEERTGNALLVGDAGVGKTELAYGLAERMAEEDVPAILQDKRFVNLDIGALVAGAGQGALEQRMKTVITEAARAGNVLLFIDDIGFLIGAGSLGGGVDAASMLTNAMSEGLVKVIATATTEDYSRLIQNQSAFLRRFQKIRIEEMTDNEAIRVLEGHASGIEYRHKIYFTYQSIASAVTLSRRYIHDRYLPSKALDILEEAAVYTRNTKGEKQVVTREEVAKIIAEKTNIKITTITEKEGKKLLNLEQEMHNRIVGQEEAVKLAAQAIRRARTELRDPKRPIINLLFLGPTGVGKTELAKTIADVYFGAETRMIRMDMSEYQERQNLSRLIGAPPGVGSQYGTQGQLTDAVRQNPFSLVLLDEIEKAHPEILNIFLQVLDDGRLTDGTGRTVDFTNAIIIATSNAGSQYIQDSVHQQVPIHDIKEHLLNEVLRDYFRPEFLNRFDGVVVFTPLDQQQVIQIAMLRLKEVAARLEKKGILFRASDEAVRELSQRGFDPRFGARPLKRIIQDEVDNALANFLLQGQIGRRDVAVLEPGGTISIEKAQQL